MRIFYIHLSITVIFAFLVHKQFATYFNGIVEFLIYLGLMLLFWLSSYFYKATYFKQFKTLIVLIFYFVKKLFLANIQIISYIITPGLKFRPAILKLPLDVKSETGIVLLANLITLTPGTLTLEISEDRKFLFFHSVNVPDRDYEKAKSEIKNGFERIILKALK